MLFLPYHGNPREKATLVMQVLVKKVEKLIRLNS